MTPKQLFSRFKAYLQTLTWGATANLVFGERVFVVYDLPIQNLPRWGSPSAWIQDRGGVCDAEHPGLLTVEFSITIFVENLNDPLGECAIIGANRTDNTSDGAGVLDIADELLSKLVNLTELTSMLLLIEKKAPRAQFVGGANFPLVTCPLAFEALCSIY